MLSCNFRKKIFIVEKLITMPPLFCFFQVFIVQFSQLHQYWVPGICVHFQLWVIEAIPFQFIFSYF